MNVNAKFAEQVQACAAFIPVDMSSAANTGDWISMKGYERATVLVYKAAGTAGDDPVITIQQATANDGSGAKALNFTSIHEKVGTLTSVGQYTEVTQSAGNTYENTSSAESAAIFIIDFLAEDLDADGGFDHIQCSIADVGTNAQLGCAMVLLWGARYAGELESAL